TINYMNSRIQTQRFTNNSNNSTTENIINPNVKILFRNKDFLVVDKPIDGDTSKAPTVSSLLYAQDPTLPIPLRNVHQLDHATSGCYCLALSKKAAGIASVAFAKRKVEKTYSAIVRGWLKDDSYVVDQPIAQVPNNRYRMCIGTSENPGKYLGHPIVGDWHYESQIMEYTDTFRMMLHALKLRIPLNTTQHAKTVNVENKMDESGKCNDLEMDELDVVSEDPFPILVYDLPEDK
ncbi:5874_t:CDS:2, partial [Scutellospora calospora]